MKEMRRFCCLLILALLSAQADDAWAAAALAPSASSLTDEVAEEYLPSQQCPEQEAAPARPEPAFPRLAHQALCFPPVRTCEQPGLTLPSRSPLYLLTSLQI